MNKLLFLLCALILSAASLLGQTFKPVSRGVYASVDGGVTWTPSSGVGAGTPLPFVPPAFAAYCSADAGVTWLPCAFGGGGGGSGTVTAFIYGTNSTIAPLYTCSVATATTTPTLNCTIANAAQNSVWAGPPTGGAGAPSYQTAPTFAVTNLTGIGAFSTTGTAGGLSANIAESQVTNLVGDLGARPTGAPTLNHRVQMGNGLGSIGDGCATDDGTTFDTGNCLFTIYGKGLVSSGTAPTISKFARFTNNSFTAATAGDLATSANLFLIAGSHVIGGVTYYFAGTPGSVVPATFSNTAVDGNSVEYDPTTQLAVSVATCNAGNWEFGKTDGIGNVISEPHRCAYLVKLNGANLTTPTSANFQNSTTNAVGLTVTFSNPSGNNVLAEITGGSYTGTASNLSGTPALPNGVTGTTQTVGDNTNKLATDAFVLANAGGGGGNGTPILSIGNFGVLAANTYFNQVGGSGTAVTTENQKQTYMPGPGTFTNLNVQAIATTAAGTVQITMRKNAAPSYTGAVDTALTCTVTASTPAGIGCTDLFATTGHSVVVAAGDLIDWKIVVATASTTNATIAYPSVLFK